MWGCCSESCFNRVESSCLWGTGGLRWRVLCMSQCFHLWIKKLHKTSCQWGKDYGSDSCVQLVSCETLVNSVASTWPLRQRFNMNLYNKAKQNKTKRTWGWEWGAKLSLFFSFVFYPLLVFMSVCEIEISLKCTPLSHSISFLYFKSFSLWPPSFPLSVWCS